MTSLENLVTMEPRVHFQTILSSARDKLECRELFRQALLIGANGFYVAIPLIDSEALTRKWRHGIL